MHWSTRLNPYAKTNPGDGDGHPVGCGRHDSRHGAECEEIGKGRMEGREGGGGWGWAGKGGRGGGVEGRGERVEGLVVE